MSLSKTFYPLLSTGSKQEASRHDRKIVDKDVKNQLKTKQINSIVLISSSHYIFLNPIVKCQSSDSSQ